jgi:hypothetical protein
MRKIVLALLFLIAATVRADCTGPTIKIAVDGINVAFDAASAPALQVNGPAKITVGKTELETTVLRRFSFVPGADVSFVFKTPADVKIENGIVVIDADLAADKATLVYTDNQGKEQSADLCFVGQINRNAQSFHVGPVMAEEKEGTANDARPAAFRVQYERSLLRYRVVRPDEKVSSRRNMEQELAISIDTTDQKGRGFVDDNRIHAAAFSPALNSGSLFNSLRVGVIGEHARALHGGDHNSDLTLTVDTGLPFFQSKTLFSSSRYLAPPLHLRLSAGRRWQNVDKIESSGPVADVALLYHLYLFNDYRVDFEYRTLFNDVDNRPATTPRTQRTWKAAIFYAPDVDTPFAVVASFENGHSGPVFTDVKQFFVGIGVKNLFSRLTPAP